MSILERSTWPPPPPARSKPRSDRLRVITAGRVGNMDARLGTSGFDVVAVAETEDALIDAVSADEADAIVVEADLCDSLERVRDLAPDALLIVVGDHTPAGALGRIERGVSGTVMAGLLHALVAEGLGAAAVWGFVPAFGPRGALQVPHRISGWLLSAKADLVREYVANAFHDPVQLATAAGTVVVTISASLVLAVSAARTHERPHERSERVHVPATAVERAPQYPADAVSPTTPTLTYGPSGNEDEPGGRWGPDRGESWADGRSVGEDADDLGEIANAGDDNLGEIANAGDDGESESENAGDDGESESENAGDDGESDGDDHGKGENPGDDHGKGETPGDDHGKGENPGKGETPGDDHGKGENPGDDHGKGETPGDESDGGDQDGDESDGGEEDGDEQDGDEQDGDGDTATAPPTSTLSPTTGVALTY
jgi:hypothetical protein